MTKYQNQAREILDRNPTIPGEAREVLEKELAESLQTARQNYICLMEDIQLLREDLQDVQEELDELIDSGEEPWKDDGQSLFNRVGDPQLDIEQVEL